MSQSRNDQPIDVSEDPIHRFTLLGWHIRKLRFQITRLDGGQHWQFWNAFEIIGNPVDKLVPEATKVFLIHVA